MDEVAQEVKQAAPPPGKQRRPRAHPTTAFLVMALLLIAKIVTARWLIFGQSAAFDALVSESVFVVAVLGLVNWLSGRRRFTAYIVLDAVFSLSLIVLTEYVCFYEQMFAPGALRLAGQVGAVWSSILELSRPAFLIYIVDLPVLLALRGKVSALLGERPRLAPAPGFVVAVSLIAAPALAIWAGSAGMDIDGIGASSSRGVLAYESAALAKYVFQTGVLGVFGVAQPLPSDAAAKELDYTSPRSVQAAIDAEVRRGKEERIADFEPGAYAGSNVIVVQVESLQRFAVDPWITPRLDALAGESWYFPNGFTQSGLGTTSDAEFVMNTSLYPPTTDPASVAYVDRVLPSLPRLLKEHGYRSFTMHVNTARFWNRQELYPALGFTSYYDRTFFGTDHKIGMGSSDRSLFREALPVIAEEASKGPIYCQLVTITPHHPFNMPPATVKIDLPEWLKGSIVGDYLEAMNYEDRAVGEFIDGLKSQGLWEDSIVVIYGDHAGLRTADLNQDNNRGRIEAMLGRSYTALDRANIPIIIHLPRQRAGVLCSTPAGQVDILPTLADALGLDLTNQPHFGRSVFNDGRPLLVGKSGLPGGSFINRRIVCAAREDFGSSEAIAVRSGLATDLEPGEEADWKAVRTLQAISDTFVQTLPKREGSNGTEGAIIPRKK